jgi:hypothetical protein
MDHIAYAMFTVSTSKVLLHLTPTSPPFFFARLPARLGRLGNTSLSLSLSLTLSLSLRHFGTDPSSENLHQQQICRCGRKEGGSKKGL